jgi:hypothetical protein
LERFVPALADVLYDEFRRPILPARGERLAVSFECPKTAALVFDRVLNLDVLNPSSGYPEEVLAYGATEAEIVAMAIRRLFAGGLNGNAVEVIADLLQTPFADTLRDDRPFARALAEALARERHVDAVAVLGSVASRDAQYQAGSHEIIVAVLQGVAVADEAQLTWEQVLEFRHDKTSLKQYRRFVHWLDSEMIGKPPGFIADELLARCDSYEAALRKHGVATAIGCS